METRMIFSTVSAAAAVIGALLLAAAGVFFMLTSEAPSREFATRQGRAEPYEVRIDRAGMARVVLPGEHGESRQPGRT